MSNQVPSAGASDLITRACRLTIGIVKQKRNVLEIAAERPLADAHSVIFSAPEDPEPPSDNEESFDA